MIEPHEHELYNESGSIDYDKVVELINSYLILFLRTSLTECFALTEDNNFHTLISDANSQIRNQAIEELIAKQHIISSEFYVDLESKFYVSTSANCKNSSSNETHEIDTDHIELALTIDNLIKKTSKRHSEALEKLELRLKELTLFAHQEFNIYCLHPQEFYSSLKNAISLLNLDIDGKVFLCKLFYQQISPKLNEFYTTANQLLIDLDILPTIESIKNAGTCKTPIHLNDEEIHLSTGQFFASVEQEFNYSPAQYQSSSTQNLKNYSNEQNTKDNPIQHEPTQSNTHELNSIELNENIINLILQPYKPGTNTNSTPAQRREFIHALSAVQYIEAANKAILKTEQIKTAIKRVLHENGALDAELIVRNEEKIINFVSKTFNVVLDDSELCDETKALLARLKVSIIKLALIDFTFFQNSNHPARSLLNKLASIDTSDSNNNKFIFKNLESIVDLIINNFGTDVSIFKLALSKLQDFDIDNLEQEITAEKERQRVEKIKEKRSYAKRVVIHTIKRYLDNRELPNAIFDFIIKCWAPHMGIVFTKHGKNSKYWRKSVRTLRRIIEVSQGVHSLPEIQQYIKQPDDFFTYIRIELEYLSKKKQEFDEITEAAEVWYLTYLHDTNQKHIESHDSNSTNNEQLIEDNTSNVIQLFENISPKETTAIPETLIREKPDFNTNNNTNDNSDIDGDSTSENKNPDEMLDEHEFKPSEINVVTNKNLHLYNSKTDSLEPKKEKIEDHGDNNEMTSTVTELPSNIMPGVWLEIYQGEDKAKRRLKYTSKLENMRCLLFTDRTGDYKFEIDIETFMHDFNAGRTCLIGESNRFDLALSSVISNFRDGQNKVSSSN